MPIKLGILSTAANPLHKGHLAMAEWGDKNGYKVVFELSEMNADKGKIEKVDLDKRLQQFYNICRPVIVTPQSTFFAKLKYLRQEREQLTKIINYNYGVEAYDYGISFFVGYDTILRVNDIRYYHGSEYERDRLLDGFFSNFVVFEREGLSDIDVLCPKLRGRCTLAKDYTGLTISSTDIRNAQNAANLRRV